MSMEDSQGINANLLTAKSAKGAKILKGLLGVLRVLGG